ncbi:MAG: 2-dehydropantoate 2-reductase [Kangiellaceae bacterium]|nr:2-dehydropantoate 2-reductase [Kangiellaceae bacterium]
MHTKIINIIGNGSIGHLWAAHFYDRKISFNLYGRTAKPNQTYKLASPYRNFSYQTSVKTLDYFQPSDLTIVCVKAYSLESVCQKIDQSMHSPEIVLLMMNGMGLIEVVKKTLVTSSIYHASITHGANLSGFLLEHTGTGTTLIGDTPIEEVEQSDSKTLTKSHSQTHTKIRAFIPLLNRALPNTIWNENQRFALWQKLLVNSIINPLTAHYRVKNGSISSDPKIRTHAARLCKELAPIIEQYLPEQNWQKVLEDVISISVQTSNNYSSMLKDVVANRPTEIAYITGYLLNKAEQLGCELNAHSQLYGQMRTTRDNCRQ